MCFGLGLLGKITGAGKSAKALRKQAEQEAQDNRFAAQAAQQARENSIAQQKASDEAAALLSRPIEGVSVQVGETGTPEVDPNTGRRRTPRSTFQMGSSQSGLRL